MPENPLVSLILVSYRQENFIRDAIAGALAQTYSPLEIIISDDCSPDRTFEIIQDVTLDYQGPHKIIIHRNPKNLGVCGNLNSALKLSSGELIVTSAGDDICYPNRCEILINEWLTPGRKWHSIYSNADLISEDGIPLGPYSNDLNSRDKTSVETTLKDGIAGVAGCTHAFSRMNYEVFGPIPEKAPGEDEILGFRSLLLGGIRYIPSMLISYRKHSDGLYKDKAALRKMTREARNSAIREDERACGLRYKCYCDYIAIAAKANLLPQETADRYLDILHYRYPFHHFVVTCKSSIFYSALQLVKLAATGKYRSGMLQHFKHTYIPFGIRTSLHKYLKGK